MRGKTSTSTSLSLRVAVAAPRGNTSARTGASNNPAAHAGSAGSTARDKRIDEDLIQQVKQEIKQRQQHVRQILSSKTYNDDYKQPHTADGVFDGVLLPNPSPMPEASLYHTLQQYAQELTQPLSLQLQQWEQQLLQQPLLLLNQLSKAEVWEQEQLIQQLLQQQQHSLQQQYQQRLQQIQQQSTQEQQLIQTQQQTRIQQQSLYEQQCKAMLEEWKTEQQQAFVSLEHRLQAILMQQHALIRQQYGKSCSHPPMQLPAPPSWLQQVWPAAAAVWQQKKKTTADGRVVSSLSSSPSSSLPRVVKVKFDSLRAIKNKLPAGEYSIIVTVMDSVGGTPLHTPCAVTLIQPTIHLSSSLHPTSTRRPITHFDYTHFPQKHSGNYQAIELLFDQPENVLYLTLPAAPYSTYQMTLLIELCALSSSHYYKDNCVIAYSYFPLCNRRLAINTGAYKVPLLRGESIATNFTRYSELMESWHKNLDHWLCNLYFYTQEIPVQSTPRVWRKQYQDHTDSVNPLLRAQTRVYKAYAILYQAVVTPLYTVHDVGETHTVTLRQQQLLQQQKAQQEAKLREIEQRAKTQVKQEERLGSFGFLIKSLLKTSQTQKTTITAATTGTSSSTTAATATIEDQTEREEKEYNRKQILKQRLLSLAQHHHSLVPHTPHIQQNTDTNSTTGNTSNTISTKTPAVASVMGTTPPLTFLLSALYQYYYYKPHARLLSFVYVIFFVLSFFWRLLIHFASEYVVLSQVFQIPLSAISIQYLYVVFQYDTSQVSDTMLLPYQWYINLVGGLSHAFLLLTLMCLHRLCRSILSLPDLYYDFMLFYAFHAIFDTLCTLLIEAWYSGQGEFAVLFTIYQQQQLGYIGGLLILTIVCVVLVINVCVSMMYLLYEYQEGVYSDVYRRVTANECMLMLPLDVEVNARLVRHVLLEAVQYRGRRGGRRRVMVQQYILSSKQQEDQQQQPQEQGQEESQPHCLHVSIYNVIQRQRVISDKQEQHHQSPQSQSPQHQSPQTISEPQSPSSAPHTEELMDRQLHQSTTAAASSVLVDSLSSKPRLLLVEDRELYRHFIRFPDGTWIECIPGAESYGGEYYAQREQQELAEQDKKQQQEKEEEEKDIPPLSARRGEHKEEEKTEDAKHPTANDQPSAQIYEDAEQQQTQSANLATDDSAPVNATLQSIMEVEEDET